MRVAPDRPDHSENVGIALSQNPVTAATAATVTLYSADGLIAVQEEHNGVVADVPQVISNSAGDDDLTSLTWLQDKNLLKSVHELPKHEFISDNASDSALSNSSASSSSSHKTSNQCVNVMPRVSYDPQVHVNSKPPFSFSCLIFMAIEDSVDKALPVKDIYVWILNHFPYYRNAPTGWKNSVRHNLSLNKCFKKVDKSPNLGKGSLWMVEQRFRPCLIQALQKTPHHQYHKFIRNLNNNNNSNNHINNNHSPGSYSKPTSEKINICDNDDMKPCTNDEIVHESTNLPSADICAISQTSQQTGFFIKENLAEDVDVDAAATAMLVLKHGAYAFDIKPENVGFVLSDDKIAPSIQNNTFEEQSESSNGANDDHNYGCHHPTPVKFNVTSDSDEKGPMNNYWITIKDDIEEQRKIVEGADALLNLAGITTYNTRKRPLPSDEQRNVKQQSIEQISLYKPRLLRKEKIYGVHSKEPISSSEMNQIIVDDDVDYKNVSKISADIDYTCLNDEKKSCKNRVTVTSNRRLRNKKNKKEKMS